MLQTTAQRFGSTGKSFVSPSAAAAVIGATLLASGTTDEAETAWSPAAACLLPDVLPVAGTLLSYGGSRQLAAGGTVSHSGELAITDALRFRATDLYGNPSTYPRITQSGVHNASDFNFYPNTDVNGVAMLSIGNYIVTVPSLGITNGASTSSSLVRLHAESNKLVLWNSGASAYGGLTCGAITASGYITSNAAVPGFEVKVSGTRVGFIYTGSSQMCLYSDVGYPWVVESNGGFRVRNTANSADAALACGAITASGAIQETPTQSALDPTTTNIPSGKRQGWYNSTLSEFRDWVNIGGTLLKSAAYT